MTPAKPLWSYTLPQGFSPLAVRFDDAVLALGGRSGLLVLTAKSGSLQWSTADNISSLALERGILLAGTSDGKLVVRGAFDGAPLWRRTLCRGSSPWSTRVDEIAVGGDDVIAACAGGTLVRLALATGRELHRASPFPFDKVLSLQRLSHCVLAVSGFTSGAITHGYLLLLDCKTLRMIVPQREDTSLLGVAGHTAILDDLCCQGRTGVYRPATIVPFDLTTKTVGNEIDLRPEPARHPAQRQPPGQASAAIVAGSRLFLGVEASLYRYPDVRTLPAGEQLIRADLLAPLLRLGRAYAVLRLGDTAGNERDEIVDLAPEPARVVWSGAGMYWSFSYDRDRFSDIVAVSHGLEPLLFVRLSDGAQVAVEPRCNHPATNRTLLATVCTRRNFGKAAFVEEIQTYAISP